ncbi:hypothetical protein [Marinibactrum halimedae]|uniref:Uncharacterized protein n=1 Tax=Marinibactrum halimedae TaxID=1444977 RepID=A0AA37T9C7_9GAMM|nr:hypothetical protein [Marinibactrum halimedae]MCD9457858.1 hypothetical protein [Marinibactrum halimedae]GLS26321.1 hypothetical protein GCM10007877_20360 [Marinibactrum halimedae]
MNTVIIVSIIVTVLIALVCYAFIMQTVTKKREQKQRLIAALEQRVRNFHHIISGFPDGFLSKDLNLLVFKHLVEASEQLAQLVPKDTTHVQNFEVFSKQMEELQRKPPSNKAARINSEKQAKEIKQYLSELNKFVHRLHKRGKLNDSQFENYSGQIKKIVLRMAVDSYVQNAKASQDNEKPRMALHYYSLAKKLLIKENATNNFKKQIEKIDLAIKKLEQVVGQTDKLETPTSTDENTEKAWKDFDKDEDSWKKKAIYD